MPQALSQLETEILRILQEAKGEPLTIPHIEKSLPEQLAADTFDVRKAVWRLVGEGRAQFTPRRYVQAGGM
jgi:hypothetical protein